MVEKVLTTASKGGSDLTASSKAPLTAMSLTIAKSRVSGPCWGYAFLMLSAFEVLRTVVTTEYLEHR